MRRINLSSTAKVESRILDYFVNKIPLSISPDCLTATAFMSAIFGGLSYLFAERSLLFLLLVNLCLFIHWFADGLDGRLARFRKISRPKYGYYIDHILDVASAGLLLGGLVTSAITVTSSWLWVMVLMLLAMTNSFLKNKVFGVFELSIQNFGPTEARMGLIFTNFIIILFGNPNFQIVGIPTSLIDLIGAITAVGFLVEIGRAHV